MCRGCGCLNFCVSSDSLSSKIITLVARICSDEFEQDSAGEERCAGGAAGVAEAD